MHICTVLLLLNVIQFVSPFSGLQSFTSSHFSPSSLPVDGSEPFYHFEVQLLRQVNGFGFRIIGGREEGSQVSGGQGWVGACEGRGVHQ